MRWKEYMNNDRIFGFLLLLISFSVIIFEGLFLIVVPFLGWYPTLENLFFTPVYWAIAVPIVLGSLGVFGILAWIGYTLMVTPPPETWNYEEESDSEDEKQEESTDEKQEGNVDEN